MEDMAATSQHGPVLAVGVRGQADDALHAGHGGRAGRRRLRSTGAACWSAAAAAGAPPRPAGLVADAALLHDDALRASLLHAGFAVTEPTLVAPGPAAITDGLLVDAVARRALGMLLEALAARSSRS